MGRPKLEYSHPMLKHANLNIYMIINIWWSLAVKKDNLSKFRPTKSRDSYSTKTYTMRGKPLGTFDGWLMGMLLNGISIVPQAAAGRPRWFICRDNEFKKTPAVFGVNKWFLHLRFMRALRKYNRLNA